MSAQVTITKRRTDGRSNQQVIADHVSRHEPGRVFTYDELACVLADGTDREFTKEDVQHVVWLSKPQMLAKYKRTLTNVSKVGYRLAHAREHTGIADGHTKKGSRQMRRALATMEHARTDEMTQVEREIHNAQLTINNHLYYTVQRIQSRQDHHGDIIARLAAKVDQLEAKVEDNLIEKSS